MNHQRSSSHSVHQLQVNLVWVTKYRYAVLQGEVQLRCRELIRQTCNALDIQILKGVVSKDHIHLHLSYPPSLSVSDMVKRLKGRSAKLLLTEYPELKRRYWAGLSLQRSSLGHWLWCLERGLHHRRVVAGVLGPS